jgi:hypothetical protein
MDPKASDAVSYFRRRFRLQRIGDRIRLCSEPVVVIGLHLLAALLVALAVGRTVRDRPVETIEVTVSEAQELELEPPEETPLDDLTETDEIFDFSIPSPEAMMDEAPPAIEDFSALPPVESPVVLSGFSMMDTGLSSAQLERAGAGASLFGYARRADGDLVGTLYDLKRDRSGGARDWDYTRDVRSLVEARFSPKSLGQFYRVPKQLYLSRLLLPYTPASEAPKVFGVDGKMEPRGWVIHYTGQFRHYLPCRYRFVGEFDDILLVFVNGELVLEANWGEPITDFRPEENVDKYVSITTKPLTYGKWFDLKPMQPARIDIVIGENPGGWVGGLLLVECEGQPYAHDEGTKTENDPAGRAILPLFSTQPLTDDDLELIRGIAAEKHFAIAEDTPVMGVRSDDMMAKYAAAKAEGKAEKNDDVSITIE